ncbi:hypothetical protein G3I40_32565, partial [Streptomyces sp. SID14478]|nr:hypothetical protein [Streptomyces sp. SID14478]
MTDVGRLSQLPDEVGEFADYLQGLLARIDQGAGWCGVFWQRDPEGMKACLDGREVPPWDVVESLVQDIAATYGADAAARESARARALQRASARAYDAGPGGAESLAGRLATMLREQHYADERRRESGRRLDAAGTPQEAEAIRLEAAWARDDHERASARIVELRARKASLEARTADPERSRPAGRERVWPVDPERVWPAGPERSRPAGPERVWPAEPERSRPVAPERVRPAGPERLRPVAAPKQVKERKRRPRGSARFAGMPQEAAPPPDTPPATAAPAPGVGTPRGARFAGSTDEAP